MKELFLVCSIEITIGRYMNTVIQKKFERYADAENWIKEQKSGMYQIQKIYTTL